MSVESGYDVVIATRNRPEVLRVSIPLLLRQSIPPSKIIVIDSSDDHQPVCDAVAESTSNARLPVVVEHAAPSAAGQRNRGIELVDSPVVFFPDDDSLYFPDAAEKMLRVYWLDKAEAIGEVCSAESPVPPPSVAAQLKTNNHMRSEDRLRQRVAHLRSRIERSFFPDPFLLWGRECMSRFDPPEWFVSENAIPVEYMTGFRMSFRTEVIRDIGFDGSLGRYSLNEDISASFGVWGAGRTVVGARDARIFHYKAPGRRTAGREAGVQEALNRAFVIAAHARSDSLARKRVLRYARYKCLHYLLGARSEFGRDRLKGTWTATRVLNELLEAAPDQLHDKYLELRQRCLGAKSDTIE